MSLRVANRALRRIHADEISSLGGENRPSRIVADELDAAARWVLRRSGWTEASTTVCPARVTVSDPAHDLPTGFCYAYELPGDLIRIRRVDAVSSSKGCPPPDLQWKRWKIRTAAGVRDALISDCDPVKVDYVCLPSDLDDLPPELEDAVVMRLAMRLSATFPIDKSLYEMIFQELKDALSDAKDISASQDQEDDYIADGELIEARCRAWGGYGSFFR